MSNRNGIKSYMPWENWPSRWQAALDACKAMGGTVDDLVIDAPALISEVEAVEAKLGLRLPESLRTVLLQFSSRVGFSWYLPKQTKLAEDLSGIFSGECSWDLAALPGQEEARQSWVDTNFPNIDDPYDRVWHNKLAFMYVANGDMIALDLSDQNTHPVVYLSHEGDESHGYRLGDDFIDFIDKWSLLGCPGSEDWQMTPFISSPTSGLEPHGENARLWREWFGLNI